MAASSPLVEALEQRGFMLRCSVRVDECSQVIKVIKEVRALTGWGLAQAKRAVEDRELIVADVSPGRARAAATLLEDAGATVELLVSGTLLAFDPADPRRGEQPLERLRTTGDLGLALDHGQLGRWTTVEAEPLANTDALLAAIDEQREAWTRAGKHEIASELALLEQVSARDLALEQRLRTSDDDERVREAAVYGDWLQTHGDPRGLIAAAALAGNAAELERLSATYPSHLYGPARELLEPGERTWSGPILDTLTVDVDEAAPLAELFATPILAGPRSLRLRFARQLPHPSAAELGERLAAAAFAPGLRALIIDDVEYLHLVGDAFVRLESLEFSTGLFSFKHLRLPALRRLAITQRHAIGSPSDLIADLEAPALAEFSYTTRTYDYWDQHNGPFQDEMIATLRKPAFARLRRVKLATSPDSIPAFAGFAELLAEVPAIATLERVDLRELIMNPACAEELERARDRLPGLVLPGDPAPD